MKLKKDSQIMWRPAPNGETQMDLFRLQISRKFGVCLENYQDLWNWSVNINYAAFWEEFWHFSKLKYSQVYERVVDTTKNISEIPEWFQGSRLNFAENLLQGNDSDVALYVAGERRKLERVTFGELKKRVTVLASALKNNGVKCGDRVVGYIPNCSLAVEAMLAAASLGAIWSSTSPDFGVTGVLDRFAQIKPKVIFSVDAVIYNDKSHDHLQKLKNVVDGLPGLEKVIIMPYVNIREEIDITKIPNSVYLQEFLTLADAVPMVEFVQVPFNHPLFIMFSSGTTGSPKCMVHSVGGTLIQHLKEHILHGDMRKTDIMFYYSTTGWMMWNWLISALAVGASVVLYDGSPFIPSPMVLWDLIDEIGVTILGTGARWLEALGERNVMPMKSHKLYTLHTILSTGSPLKPYSYEYVYTSIKKNLLLGSITGGTDIISCFAGQNPTIPVYKGEIQSRNLGMAVECWDEQGKQVFDGAGELVCTKPFPSMPIYFWNDADGKKYHKAYFAKFPGIWSHGDFCQISSDTGGIVMLGRSDGTLNPNGVRFGSAEIYNIVESSTFPEIADSLCVAHSGKNLEKVILFLKMADDNLFTESLIGRIKSEIRRQLSARHVPNLILPTTDIPYTTSGKKVEIAVKKILAGEHVTQRGTLINPDSLDLFYNIPELQESL